MQIIVLGMHRSGTSLVTRLINMMGAYFGPETSVGEITPDNPKGFWERPEIFKLNEAILGAKGCSWHELKRWNPHEAHIIPGNLVKHIEKTILGMDAFRPWVLKDPRLCLLLPAWRPFLEVPIAVIVHRDPVEIALSLQKRDGFTLEYGVHLWEQYARNLLNATRDMPKIFVQHSHLLQNPVQTCQTLYEKLVAEGVRRLEIPSDKEILAFTDPSLYRSKSTGNDYRLSPQQQELVERMRHPVA